MSLLLTASGKSISNVLLHPTTAKNAVRIIDNIDNFLIIDILESTPLIFFVVQSIAGIHYLLVRNRIILAASHNVVLQCMVIAIVQNSLIPNAPTDQIEFTLEFSEEFPRSLISDFILESGTCSVDVIRKACTVTGLVQILD